VLPSQLCNSAKRQGQTDRTQYNIIMAISLFYMRGWREKEENSIQLVCQLAVINVIHYVPGSWEFAVCINCAACVRARSFLRYGRAASVYLIHKVNAVKMLLLHLTNRLNTKLHIYTHVKSFSFLAPCNFTSDSDIF
jgi:hypothetical protein